jgi:2-polyprenyl-6-methoxyphenol hydroxylase-like FAD-dependent oxidoreductase
MSRETFDVAIIGARVAGATLAALLGRAGLKVLLVDAGRFPSDTVSTHFFRGAAFLSVLRRSGALDAVLRLGSPPLRREYLYTDGSAAPEIGPPQNPGEIGFSLSVRRISLDAALVAHATASGAVELRLGTRATALRRAQGVVTGVELESSSGHRTAEAALVVGADGRHSWLAREVSAPVQAAEDGHRGMFYAYYAGFEGPTGTSDGAEFSTHGDEIAYVFPSDGGVACIALSVDPETFRWCRVDSASRFEARLVERHPGIGHRLRGARRVGRMMGVGPEPNFVRRPWGHGWALVGDSEMHQDPFAGQGIDSAGLHAVALAEQIVRWRRGESDWAAAGGAYARDRDAQSLETCRKTVATSRNLASPSTTSGSGD